jgi:hypothetical protein
VAGHGAGCQPAKRQITNSFTIDKLVVERGPIFLLGMMPVGKSPFLR